jgi:hypothetical protein
MRTVFQRALKIAPGQYRRHFRSAHRCRSWLTPASWLTPEGVASAQLKRDQSTIQHEKLVSA